MYEVTSPGDYLVYRLRVLSVANEHKGVVRADRNCLQIAEVGMVGPCSSSSLLLHLDADAVALPHGSLVQEWRDLSGHGHHARRLGPPAEGGLGAPTLVLEPISGRQAVRFEYAPGGSFLEAAGLSIKPDDSMTVFVVARTETARAGPNPNTNPILALA